MSEKEFKACNLSDVIPDGTQLAQANMFYCGDWAYVKKIGKKGLVKEAHVGEYEQLVTLLMEDGTMLKVRSDECDFTTPDPKTAFLTELKDLLDKYNASMYVDFDQSDEIYTTTIAVGEDSVKYSNTYGIDTDNVFNYDK